MYVACVHLTFCISRKQCIFRVCMCCICICLTFSFCPPFCTSFYMYHLYLSHSCLSHFRYSLTCSSVPVAPVFFLSVCLSHLVHRASPSSPARVHLTFPYQSHLAQLVYPLVFASPFSPSHLLDQLFDESTPGAVISHGAELSIRTVVDLVVKVHLLGQLLQQLDAVAVVAWLPGAVGRLVFVHERRHLRHGRGQRLSRCKQGSPWLFLSAHLHSLQPGPLSSLCLCVSVSVSLSLSVCLSLPDSPPPTPLCVSVSVSLCLSGCLSVCPSPPPPPLPPSLSLSVSLFLSLFLSVCLPACLPVCLSVSICQFLSICMSVSLCLFLSICLFLSVCLSVFLCNVYLSVAARKIV